MKSKLIQLNFSDFGTAAKKAIRLTRWWTFLVPFLLGLLYVNFYLEEISAGESLLLTVLFFITFCGTIAFGYFLNDVTDIGIDREAGITNLAAANGSRKNYLILFILIVAALLPWLFLPRNQYNVSLYIFQLLLLFTYSVFPIRLKRYPIACVITDALYNSAVPLLIIFSTFIVPEVFCCNTKVCIVFITTILWAFLKGIRGILLHQIGDRNNDRKTSINTFVLYYGPLKSFKLIWNFTFRIEIILFSAIVIYLSLSHFPFLFLILPVFYIYLFLYLRLWENFYRRRREIRLAANSIFNLSWRT